MDNPTLRKALFLLVHPATLGAIVLLFVNDHILRRFWPSDLTGKLGDFAWLFFVPLVFVALFSLVWPGTGPRRRRAIPVLAFGLVTGVFAFAKSMPAAHTLTLRMAEGVFGFPVAWRLDPTDLVALVSVGLSALLWVRRRELVFPRITLRSPGWLALIAASLLTTANAPAPEPGVYCLDAREGELLAYAAYSAFRSVDGGLNWAPLPNSPRGACPNPWGGASGTVVTAVDPRNEQRSYRFTPGGSIEFSDDGGMSWQTVYTPPTLSEADAAVTRKEYANAMLGSVPFDGKVDRVTGNAVFAMGHGGVLVRQLSDGDWLERPVGSFRPLAVNRVADFLSLLVGEALLALGLALLAVAVFATRTLVRGRALWVFALGFGWLLWAVILFIFPPALAAGYGTAFSFMGLLVLGILLLITTIISIVGLAQDGRVAVVRSLLAGLFAGLVFLIPFGLWAVDALPRYLLAAAFAAALGIGTIIVANRWVTSVIPATPQDASDDVV